jgi:hypothetical protein
LYTTQQLYARKALAMHGRSGRSSSAIRNPRQLLFEQLEERITLSASVDPALFILTHGFRLTGADAPSWVEKLQEDVSDTIKATSPSLEHEFIVHNWAQDSREFGASGRKNAVQQISSCIQTTLAVNSWNKVDLFFLGHSRGGVVNSQVVAEFGTDERFQYVEVVSLDTTAAIPMFDNSVDVQSVPESVDRAINYDDGHPLVGLEILGHRVLTIDGFELAPESPTKTAVSNRDVGVLVDFWMQEHVFAQDYDRYLFQELSGHNSWVSGVESNIHSLFSPCEYTLMVLG